MTTRATLGRSIGVDASRPPSVHTCVNAANNGEDDVGFVKIRAVNDANDADVTTTSEDDDDDDANEGAFGAAAFALDLRGWRFTARTQAVRALGAIGRMSAGTLKVEFRDEHEEYRARTEARGGEASERGGAGGRGVEAARGGRMDVRLEVARGGDAETRETRED